jgi:tRNA(Ile)-lysidine synthase
MIREVAAFIEEHGLVPVGCTVLVAVSGGPDSMALLDLLARLRRPMGFDLACATVDHGLRRSARDEAALVAREAAARSVPWALLEGDAPLEARRGGGPEEAARRVRFALLDAHARGCGATRIALGHTLDDQAETVILRLVRGTGLHGLGGMSPVRDGRYVRPLLGVRRRRVRAYVRDRAIPWAEDPTNRDERFVRNRIRNRVMPVLEACQPGAAERIGALADDARDVRRALDDVVRGICERIVQKRGGARVVDREALMRLDPGLRSYVMRRVLVDLKGDARRLGRRHIEAVLSICASGRGSASVDLPEGIRAERAYGELVILRPGEPCAAAAIRVHGPGRYRRADVELDVRGAGGAFPLDLRGRRPGDRLAGRTRRLGRLLIDRKVPRMLRDELPLLADGREVVWAGGLFLARAVHIEVDMRPCGRSDYLEWLGKQTV